MPPCIANTFSGVSFFSGSQLGHQMSKRCPLCYRTVLSYWFLSRRLRKSTYMVVLVSIVPTQFVVSVSLTSLDDTSLFIYILNYPLLDLPWCSLIFYNPCPGFLGACRYSCARVGSLLFASIFLSISWKLILLCVPLIFKRSLTRVPLHCLSCAFPL